MTEKYQDIAAERQAECGERAIFFGSQLRLFSKTNWITVLVPSLLGVLAGSGLFATSNSNWLGIRYRNALLPLRRVLDGRLEGAPPYPVVQRHQLSHPSRHRFA